MHESPGLKGWKSYLLWEGLPFLLPLFVFWILSAVNWGYESKLIVPDGSASDWTGIHLGLLMRAIAAGMAFVASSLLFIVRVTGSKTANGWPMLIALTVVTLFLIFPSLFIVILGPASMTMMEQMRAAPR